MTEKAEVFSGLHKEGMVFLDALQMQNDPIFFNANKEVYTEHIKKPMVELNDALEPCIKTIDFDLDTRSKRTICRIRKDARYAKEKPYRTNMWMSFKPEDRSNTDYFTYYFYYDTESYEAGIGFYGVHKVMMDKFRGRIDTNPSLFREVVDSIDFKRYKLEGEEYKRELKKFDLSDPIGQWYNKKGFYIYEKKKIDDIVFSHDLAEYVKQVFLDLVPIYDFVVGKEVRLKKIKI